MGVQAGVRRSADVVGRDAEVERLATAVRAAHDGRSTCVFLVGEAGVGKTRLLTETAASARALGMAVLVGRAAIASPTPFGVIAEALRSWHRDRPPRATDSPLDRGLQLVLPEWSSPSSEPDLPEPQLRLLAFEGVLRCIRDLATSRGGAVVVLDDLHAADPESVEAARYLAAAAVEGVCVVAGVRPWEGFSDRLVSGLSRDGTAEVVEVDPLSATAVAELVQSLTTALPPTEFVEEVMSRTDGVPLLVEEIVAAHIRAGSIGVAEGVMVWRGDAVAVPRTVTEMISTRLARLDPAERNVVCAGAVLGDFQPEILAAVSDVDDVDGAIAAATRMSLLDASGEQVSFRHAILREAVLNSLGSQAATELHRRAAAALAHAGADDAETLERRARHHEVLGDGDEAARLLTEAAHRRRRSHTLLAAEQLATAALGRALDPVRRVAAADALAEVLVAQGRWTEALEVDAGTSAAYGETPPRRIRMAAAAVEAGRPELAAELIARAVADGEQGHAIPILDGRIAMVGGDAERALACAAQVLTDERADVDARLNALDLQARAYDYLGRRTDAQAAWSLLAAQAEAERRTQARLRAAVALGKLELFAGKPPQRLREAVELARSAGAFVELAWAEENLAIGLTLHGCVEEAIAILDAAIERCRRLRLDQVAYLLAARGMAATYSGDDAEPWLGEADDVLPTADLRLHTSTGRADIALRDGRYADAVHWLEQSCKIMATMPGIVPMEAPCHLVWALAAAGREPEARSALAAARQMPDLARWHTRPLLLDAAEAVLDGDTATFDAVIAANADHLSPVDIGLMRLIAADLITGEKRLDYLREALEIYDGLGMAPTAVRIRRLLRDAGAPVPRKRRTDTGIPAELAARGVTRRELEVLRLVGEGLSNAEIAERLVVSVRTVETHVSSLLTKLDVGRRAQLVAISVQ